MSFNLKLGYGIRLVRNATIIPDDIHYFWHNDNIDISIIIFGALNHLHLPKYEEIRWFYKVYDAHGFTAVALYHLMNFRFTCGDSIYFYRCRDLRFWTYDMTHESKIGALMES